MIYDDLWKIAQKKGVMANPLRVGVIDPWIYLYVFVDVMSKIVDFPIINIIAEAVPTWQ